jgi:hypothetical protein
MLCMDGAKVGVLEAGYVVLNSKPVFFKFLLFCIGAFLNDVLKFYSTITLLSKLDLEPVLPRV